jgi:hypothetical protein
VFEEVGITNNSCPGEIRGFYNFYPLTILPLSKKIKITIKTKKR